MVTGFIFRMDILDQRLKSWSVFPVEEAVVVQDFLKQAQDEVDADIAEDLSATELQAMIERLEVCVCLYICLLHVEHCKDSQKRVCSVCLYVCTFVC